VTFQRRLAVPLLVVAAIACGDSIHTLVGTWTITSFNDHGTVGITTGTGTFDAGGTFAMAGTVTYPGELASTFDLTGSWTLRADSVDLTIEGETTAWGVDFRSDADVALSHADSEGTVVIALHHPG
jgi:hypothetical protein